MKMHFVDNASEILANAANKGFAVGLGNFTTGDVGVHTNYPDEWSSLYLNRGWIKKDPIVLNGIRTLGMSEWPDPSHSENIVIRAAADHGISGGVTISSRIAGNSCIVGLSLEKKLSTAARNEIFETIRCTHRDHLIEKATTLSTNQIDLVALFANGFRAKQVAEFFEISEEAVKQRKATIQKHFGVNSFLVVVNFCAMAGLTFPRIS